MAGKGARWLKGCGCTLAVLLVVGVLALVVASLTMMGPFRDAIEVREELDLKFGSQSDFTPAMDGTVPPDDMERFLAARRELMGMCARFEEAYDSLHTMDQFDGQDDPPKGEVLKAAFKTARGLFGIAPVFGEFIQARNQELMDNGLGLGEYTYIYSLAYGDRLVDVHTEGDVTRMQVHVSRRLLTLLQEMLRRQLDAAEPGSDWAGTLEDEIRKLERQPGKVPWTDGLPPAIEASLAPYRQDLEENYCAATMPLELSQNRVVGGGIGITGE
jgi:hypothetical protein